MRTVVVIPARHASTRLPGKPLADIDGRPMIVWVWERARLARGVDAVVVATDDERIAAAVRGAGGEVRMTSTALRSGTDRVAAVAAELDADVYVNVQGDEPLVEPSAIERAAALVATRGFEMATIMTPLTDLAELSDPNVVKVVADRSDRALYFSRLPIPHGRTPPRTLAEAGCRRHVGLYAFRRDTLLRFASLPPSPLELGEGLEQLRALEHGIAIGVAEIPFAARGVDSPEDLAEVRRLVAAGRAR